MKQFLGSLYGRISVAYLVLLLVFCVLSIVATLRFARRFTYESDQKLNHNLAEVLHPRITPFVGDSLDKGALKQNFSNFMTVNPRVDIYLVTADGQLRASSVPTDQLELQQVATEPITAFTDSTRGLPILGDDPRSADQQKIFSAAPIALGNDPGYIYIVLRSKLYDSVTSLLRDDFILRTAGVNVLLVFVFTGVAGLLVLAFITRPFRRITRTVQSFEEGAFDRRIPDLGDDELGRLAHTINRMADTVQEHMKVLKDRDDLRREFIANISHDLRSPLTSIQGYVETAIMKNDQLGEEQRLEHLRVIHEETIRLDHLIEQLLQLSRLDARHIEPELEPFAPSELVQDVVLKFRPAADKHNIDLEAALPNDLPLALADIGMIERVLSNLVENALDHTPPGGHVRINCTGRNGDVQLEVADDGSGISDEDMPHIAERFYKGSSGSNEASNTGGTGLGLAIVTRILELHDSRLEIDSTVGLGTSVTFTLAAAER